MVTLFENKGQGKDDDIVVVRGKIIDNHVVSGGVLTDEGIWEFAKKLWFKPAAWNARIEGEPKHFSGIVYGEELDRTIHIEPGYPAPPDWTFYEGVDPHDGKATKWGFFAALPERFTLQNGRQVYRIHMIDYLNVEGKTIANIVKLVRLRRVEIGYYTPQWVVLDAKYGKRTQMATGELRTTWYNELKKYDKGTRYVLSDSNPGNVETGHKIVKEYLDPKWSTLYGKAIPTFSFFDTCDKGPESPVSDMFAYSYDEEGKIIDKCKDWPDVIRYVLTRYPKHIVETQYDSRKYGGAQQYSNWAI